MLPTGDDSRRLNQTLSSSPAPPSDSPSLPDIHVPRRRPDLGYWSRTQQPTPVWVDLPEEATKLPDGEAGADGVPESGESDVRWGPVVTRKLPEVLMLQQKRLEDLTTKVWMMDMIMTKHTLSPLPRRSTSPLLLCPPPCAHPPSSLQALLILERFFPSPQREASSASQ